MADKRRLASRLENVKCNTHAIRRDGRKTSVSNPFLVGAIEVSDVNGVVALKGDVPISSKCRSKRAERGKCQTNKEVRNNSVHFELKRAHAWKTRVLDQALQIFSVGRHSINRIFLFDGGAAEKKNVVVVEPNAVPAKQFFRRQPHCFLRLEIERPERWQRPVPIFAAGFFAHVDAQKQSLAVRRNVNPTVAAHITFWHDLVDLPLCANRAVESDLIDVRDVLAKNRLSVVRPDRRVTGHFILNTGLEHMEIGAV